MERNLGLASVVAISAGAMLGSGLFVLPGLAAAKTGSSVWLAYLVAGLCVVPAALAKAELATAMPVSGGTYFYLDRAFGPMIGTIAGLGLWLSLLLKSSFALVGFGAYLDVVADVPLRPVAIALLTLIVLLNVIGVKKVGKAQVVVVGISVTCLGALAVWGATRLQPAGDQPFFGEGLGGFAATVGFVFVSYAGVTKVAAIGEEVRDPGRNLPRGMLISLLLVMVLYCVIAFVLVGVVPMDELTQDLRPIYTLGATIGGTTLGVAAAILGILTLTSMANSGLLAASRFPYAMSRDDLLPSVLSRLHPRFMTPVICVLLTAGMMAAAILFLDVAKIAKLASSLKIAAFLSVNLAVIVLRESGQQWYTPRYRVPLYPWVPLFGIVTGVVLLGFLGLTGLVALAAMSIPGGLLYLGYGRHRADRRSVFGASGPRRELLVQATRSSELELPAGETAVVVPLFGRERSPETLVEMAAALAGGRRIEVVRMLAMPEQTVLDTRLEEQLVMASLRRRIEGMSAREGIDVHFDSVISHDVVADLHALVTEARCDWLLMEWRHAERRLTLFDPLSWLVNHLPCNLALYKDAGVRSVHETMVLSSPGPHDALVVDTVQQLAVLDGTRPTFVGFVDEDAPEQQVADQTAYLEELRSLYGGDAEVRVVRGENEVATLSLLSASFDLVVMGAPRDLTLWDHVVGTAEERITRRAPCSVLRLKTPPSRTHEVIAAKEEEPSKLDDLLDERILAVHVEATKKEELFSKIAGLFAEVVPASTAAEIESALWDREKTQNTAVGHGVALPHATLATVDRTLLGVVTLARPLDLKAPDDGLVDVVFVTLGPPAERNTHLQLLATVSRLILGTDLLDGLRVARSASELRSALRASEEAVRDANGTSGG